MIKMKTLNLSPPKCKRCGKCCYYLLPKTQFRGAKWVPCKELIFLENGSTKCKRYYHRLGYYCGYGQYCGLRSDYAYNIPGCEYNQEGKPDHPYFK